MGLRKGGTEKVPSFINQVKFAPEEEVPEDDEAASHGSFHPGFARRTVDEIRDLQKAVCFETNSLRCWRVVVIFFLLITGVSIATFTAGFLRSEEEEKFEKTYEVFSDRTTKAGENYIETLVSTMREMSHAVTVAGMQSGIQFPFVTVPFFEVQSYHARLVSGVEMFVYSPVVSAPDVEVWNNYSQSHAGWIQEGRDYLRNSPPRTDGAVVLGIGDEQETTITTFIWRKDALGQAVQSNPPPHAPAWQASPPPANSRYVNYDMLTESFFGFLFQTMLIIRDGVLSEVLDFRRFRGAFIGDKAHEEFHKGAFGNVDGNNTGWDRPHSVMVEPVFEKLRDLTSPIVGVLQCGLPWDYLIKRLVTEGSFGIYVVLSNTCSQSFTWKLGKVDAQFLGKGDWHEPKWDYKMVNVSLSLFRDESTISKDGHCVYSMTLYPSDEMRSQWKSDVPMYFAYAIGGTFFLITCSFFIYDAFVRRRNKVMVQTAARNNKIVASLFPSTVRDRLLAEEGGTKASNGEQGTQTRLKNFLADDYAPADCDMETDDLMFKTKPIADLFPETTILFADIAGFTAWSSAREPSQVFTLLETVYRSFDMSARRRRIFKVETVGDCYVAASGIPEPRRDHAVAMARFAKECMSKMQALTRRLEVTLGPDTADLAMRMGMHSGPVTAGVLRGERSRFQLFGDTMNTASRMESTGTRDKIQLSQETADLLYAAGKADWIVPRDDIVNAKGKGALKTYWLEISQHDGASVASGGSSEDEESIAEMELKAQNPVEEEPKEVVFSDKALRLIDWNVDLLLRLLQLVVARRQSCPPSGPPPNELSLIRTDKTVLDEVQEIIVLPEFDYHMELPDPKAVVLDPNVELQLYEYVTAVASMYRKNPFHNFEHASHVTMSVAKLLSRIVAPSNMDFKDSIVKNQTLHDHTYGITSDPLTQFACVYSALIHDVDHTGVPNTQLVKENHKISDYYKGRSVAEQNSVDVSWDMLMQDEFSALRHAIYASEDEMRRFRQLVVNCVMATDIMDKDLKALRNARWERAFSENAEPDLNEQATINRKATIVIEHLIQASDVAHTMQHWHIYRKWNAKLFEEMYKAYKDGRAEKNPAEFWYKGEIGFFDFYIIPLAKKLKECGVFGVSSKEYLNYAEKNRQEWELKGQEVLSELVENVSKVYGGPAANTTTVPGGFPPIAAPPEAAPSASGKKPPQTISFRIPQEKQ